MTPFALLPAEERQSTIEEAANRLDVSPVIAEKDYWVFWILARIFTDEETGPHLVFKGGTSLSKVYQAIDRFSEDVDLSVAPAFLGFKEAVLDGAMSKSRRAKQFKRLQAECENVVEHRMGPRLEEIVRGQLGARPGGGRWFAYQLDPQTRSPILLFEYPSVFSPDPGYIPLSVKLEFGSLTDQRPTGTHAIRPLIAEAFDDVDAECESVVAMEIERSFWEKATILHSEYQRPSEQPIRDRVARHYSDMAALWRHPAKDRAMQRFDLLERVARFKSRFFPTGWCDYGSARPGSLRLCPADERAKELSRDYAEMEPMFRGSPPRFDGILDVLRHAEREINAP